MPIYEYYIEDFILNLQRYIVEKISAISTNS